MTHAVATLPKLVPVLRAAGLEVLGTVDATHPVPVSAPDGTAVLVLDGSSVGSPLPLYLLFALPLGGPPSVAAADACVPLDAGAATLRDTVARVAARSEASRRLTTAVASASDAWYEAQLPDGPVRWEGDLISLVGLPGPEFAPDMPTWLARIHPDDLDPLVEAVENSLRQDGPYDVAYRVRHADGGWRVWRDRGRASVTPDGSVRYVGVVSDITAESAARTRYAALNDRLRVAAAALGFGIYEFDYRHGRAWFSPEARAMLGSRNGEEVPVDGHGIPAAVLPEDAAVAQRALAEASAPDATGEVACEYRIRRPDGAIRWVQARAKLFPEPRDGAGAPAWATGVLFDVTDRREREHRLRGRESRLRDIMRTSPVGIVFARLSGEILDCNDAFLRILGYRAGEPGAPALDWRSLVVRGARTHDALAEMASTGAIAPMEMQLRRRDGSAASVLATAVRVDPAVDEHVSFVFDLTPAKEGEQRVRASERQFRLVLEDAPIPVFLHSAEGEIVARSRMVETLTGWSPEETPDARSWLARARRLEGSALDTELARLKGALRRGALQEEVDIWTKDGRRLCWQFHGSALLMGGDGRTLVTSMALDMTESRASAEALARVATDLQQTNALLDAIFTSAPIGLGFWDRELRFRRVNRRLAAMNGIAEGEHIGRTPQELLPDFPGLDEITAMWRRVMEDRRSLTYEIRGTTPADPTTEHVWREHFFPVEIAGEVVGGSAMIEDVTEQHAAAALLEESERRYRRIFEQSTTSTWEVNLADARERLQELIASGVDDVDAYLRDHPEALGELLELITIRSVNPATLRLLGLASAEEVPARVGELFTDETWACLRALVVDLAKGHQEFRSETTIRTVDGRLLHVLEHARLPAVHEPADQVLVSVNDVTALKDAETVLREANQRKDEFLAMLAHELRNPLAPIRNAAEALRLAHTEEPVVRWARDLIERQVGHLAHIVDDLLDVSRIVQGKVVLHRVPLDLRAVVRSAVETNRSIIDARGHALVLDLPAEALPVEGDFVRLAQVVGNLLTNAAKYTPEGGRITVTAREDGARLELRVRDTGEGIPRELLPQVFDLFTQAHRTIDRSQGGLGIGLTVVKRLVEMHGGVVVASSEGPGLGTEFAVRLPRATVAPGGAEERVIPRAAPRPSGPLRVLVVDDNPDAAESLAELLRLSGYAVKTAPDGGVALGMVETFRPEVLLLDLGLPGMDGFELARRLRRQPITERALLVAVSGYGRDEDVRQAHAAGFDHHLVKPVDLAALRGLLQRVA